MGKKEDSKSNLDLDVDSIQEYDKMLSQLKNDVDKLKLIKKRRKKIKKLEREKKEILKKMNNN